MEAVRMNLNRSTNTNTLAPLICAIITGLVHIDEPRERKEKRGFGQRKLHEPSDEFKFLCVESTDERGELQSGKARARRGSRGWVVPSDRRAAFCCCGCGEAAGRRLLLLLMRWRRPLLWLWRYGGGGGGLD
ncbi:unnamed protein product [Toxocara canis]|uniref:Secreted protein n=1 Tax=Toxocara canis TaxID=6265 RepID=A0A183UNR8_TOXCA|nr:unnamed protein product [Toxocara canis]